MHHSRTFYLRLIATCLGLVLLGAILFVTIVHPQAWQNIWHGPWIRDGQTLRTDRDFDGVRIQMRRAYRVTGLDRAGVYKVNVMDLHTGQTVLTIDDPGPQICFGRESLRSDDTEPWYELTDLDHSARLSLLLLAENHGGPSPVIDTRIKPMTWTSQWPRWWSY